MFDALGRLALGQPAALTSGPISAAAAAAGVAVAVAVGAATFSAPASASGTSTATAVGTAITASAGSSSGTGAASGVGTGVFNSIGSSAGASSPTAIGAATFSGVGASSGTGSAAGVGRSTAAGVFSASGVGTASGIITGITAAVGRSPAPLILPGEMFSFGPLGHFALGQANPSPGSTQPVISQAIGVGATIFSGRGSSSGTCTATFAGTHVLGTVGVSVGHSTAAAAGFALTLPTEVICVGEEFRNMSVPFELRDIIVEARLSIEMPSEYRTSITEPRKREC